MPLYLSLANLIIDKAAVQKKYPGGVERFRAEYFSHQGNKSQEDDELFLIARMNSDEFDLDALNEMGFDYDPETGSSPDFVIYERYAGKLWQADWLEDNAFYTWHSACDPRLIAQMSHFEDIRTDTLLQLFDRQINPFIPLTLGNLDSHPLVRGR